MHLFFSSGQAASGRQKGRGKKSLTVLLSLLMMSRALIVPAGEGEPPAESSEGTAVEATSQTTTEPEVFHLPTYEQAPQSNAYEGWPEGPLIEGASAVVMDLDTGAILYEKNMMERHYPASITKMMTGLLACEYLDPADTITMSEAAAYGIEPGSSTIYGDVNEVFTVEQATMGLMLESANEMALALAEKTSGSVKKFVELMNRRAAELGCSGTHFNNPNGLPDETHYTTALDMVLICRAAWQNQNFRTYFTTDYYEIPPTNVMKDTRYLVNHHKMMPGREHAYEGVQGGKTGYTEAAGNTLVTFAKRDRMSLAVVVMGSMNGAYPDTASLLDYAFTSFEHLNMKPDQKPLVQMLPAETSLLDEGGSKVVFPFRKGVNVTVPHGTQSEEVEVSQTRLPGLAGTTRLYDIYSYHGHVVGTGMQYESQFLKDLVS